MPVSPKGYSYVEVIDPKDGILYRYTGKVEEPWQYGKSYLKGYVKFVLKGMLAANADSRYGVVYNDISTREDRDYWIAGSSLKVVDLQAGEVLAERMGYMMDVCQGSQIGGRSPWSLAANHACPFFTSTGSHGSLNQPGQADRFVEKVLTPND